MENNLPFEFDESDQAGTIGQLFYLHLQQHGGVTDEECEFCKNWIIPPKINEYPLTSYKFIILDLNDKGNFLE